MEDPLGPEAKDKLADDLGHRIAAAVKAGDLAPDEVEALLEKAKTGNPAPSAALDTSGTREAVSSAVAEDKPPDISMDDLVASAARESWIHIGRDVFAIPYPRENPRFYYIIPSPDMRSLVDARCLGLQKFYPDLNPDTVRSKWKFTRTAWVEAHAIESRKKAGKLEDAFYTLDALEVFHGLGKAERI